MEYITQDDYFAGHRTDRTLKPVHRENAKALLEKVNRLLDLAFIYVKLPLNPKTKSRISGTDDGGWRPYDSSEGAPGSSHKEGRGVDVYDPDGDLDEWLDDDTLSAFDLYREHPSATRGWCHLTDRAPRSGRRSFYP